MKVLIFGQSGAKTTLCKNIVKIMGDRVVHINADEVRKEADDWDFSEQGRWRQFRRMVNKAEEAELEGKIALVDFICPYKSGREQFDADLTIFMSTVVNSKYEDTNKVFEWPSGLSMTSIYMSGMMTILLMYVGNRSKNMGR